MTSTALGYAFLGGLLPSLIWLYFLLKEDARCPEPRPVVALAFIAGMAAVPLALPLEQLSCLRFALEPGLACVNHVVNSTTFGLPPTIAWAAIEEVLKYAMAAAFILWRRAVDEPPDYVIYMLTVALGFAAAENMLYLFNPLADGHFILGASTDGLRFLGSTLLHVVASSVIGFALAFSATLRPFGRTIASAVGLILAVALHTAFNALIITGTSGSTSLVAFFLVWTLAVVFFAAFEVLKYLRYRNLPTNTC